MIWIVEQPVNFEYCKLFVQILTIPRQTVVIHFKHDGPKFNWNIQISEYPHHVFIILNLNNGRHQKWNTVALNCFTATSNVEIRPHCEPWYVFPNNLMFIWFLFRL